MRLPGLIIFLHNLSAIKIVLGIRRELCHPSKPSSSASLSTLTVPLLTSAL